MFVSHTGLASAVMAVTLLACGTENASVGPQPTNTDAGSDPSIDSGVSTDVCELIDPAIPPARRQIPLRIASLVDSRCAARGVLCGSSCAGSEMSAVDAALADALAEVNETFSAVELEFFVRSRSTVEAPHLWCAEPGAKAWAEVSAEIMAAFPSAPLSAWSSSTVKGGVNQADWWQAAATLFGARDEVIVLVGGRPSVPHSDRSDSRGTDRLIRLAPVQLDGRTLGQALGAYLGLRRTGVPPAGVDPETGYPWLYADQWDLVYGPRGPRFFDSRSCAAAFPHELRPMQPECIWKGPCHLSCQFTELTLTSGDSSLNGLSRFVGPDAQANLMSDPPGRCARFLSASQRRIVQKNLHFRPPLTAELIAAVGSLPDNKSERDIDTARPWLGLVESLWLMDDRDFCQDLSARAFVGDFNGDGRADLVCNEFPNRRPLDFANERGEFEGTEFVDRFGFCPRKFVQVGDFNGDGRDDMVCIREDDGMLFVDLTDANGEFGGIDWGHVRFFCNRAGDQRFVGDFNGDGRDDLLCSLPEGQLQIDYANRNSEFWHTDSILETGFCSGVDRRLFVGDFNGDGRDDILCNGRDGILAVDFADEAGEFSEANWRMEARFCNAIDDSLHVGDINGDLRDDLLCLQGDGLVEVRLATAGGEFADTRWQGHLDHLCASGAIDIFLADVDGRRGADLICNFSDGRLLVAKLRLD